MNWNQIEGQWDQMRGRVQRQWGKLTQSDLDMVMGKRKELAGRIKERYGIAEAEADRQIDEWLRKN